MKETYEVVFMGSNCGYTIKGVFVTTSLRDLVEYLDANIEVEEVISIKKRESNGNSNVLDRFL